MRKIKITALLLAVLMIVTAFAGCASKSTVTNLDNKVNDLDASIEEQKAALSGIESTLATISKALENQGSSENLDEVIKDIEENEKATADLAGAIKDLQAAIEDLKKEPATQAPATPDDLQVVINQYSAKLEALAGEVEDDKANYTAETLTAIRELVGEVETSIENAKDKAAVEAAYKAFTDKLADKTYMSVNAKLYAYVLELKGNITDASADKVDEAVEALEAAAKFYEDGYYAEALVEYEINDDETIDLVAAIEALEDAQYVVLPQIKAEADEIEEMIADIDESYDFYDVTEILSIYKAWEKEAKKLSPENVKLVANYNDLLAAHTSALNNDVAKTIFAAATVESALYASFGEEVHIFYDYLDLLDSGKQVLYVFDTAKEGADGVAKATKALTSKIYDAIDAWVADWAKEYGLTDLAVETIIDFFYGDILGYGENFYARYNADKALVKAFEAEAKTLADGIFKNIKALNNKRLGADAVEVLNAYKKNAADIDAWKKALVDAYEADLLADDDERETRNIYNIDLYEDALEANFNLMVADAKLCVYDETTKTYADYTLGFDATGANEYYYDLYDFKNADMVEFMLVTFQAAQDAADKINARIKNFKTAQAHSIAPIVANIGGYVEIVGNELKVVKDTAIVAGAAGTPDTIAEFIYKYKTDVKYDLSSMINVADYEAKIAEVEKNIKAADAALEALDVAYGKYLKGDGLVTLSDKAEITALYGLLTKWMAAGHVEMSIATETKTAANGVKEYKLTKLVDRYNNIDADVLVTTAANDNTKDGQTSQIVLDKYRVDLLQKQADLAVSAYTVMDKVYAFNSSVAFSYDNYSGHGPAKSAYEATRDNLGTHGVVAVTCGTPMTADGVDTLGRAYKQGMSLWTVEYVTYTDVNSKPLFITDKLEGYFFSNYTDAAAAKNKLADVKNAAGETIQEVLNKNIYGTKPANLSTYVNTLFTDIPTLVKNYGESALKDKLLPNLVLPILATGLEARFLVNNYGEKYEALDKANDKFDAENGGYGFQYVKGLSYAYVDNKDATQANTVSASNKAAVKSATDIESLRIAVKACLVDNSGSYVDEVVFGGADYSWMKPIFDRGNAYLTAKDFDVDDLTIDVLLIYRECDHTALAAATCIGHTAKCDECAELVEGTAAHVAPAGAVACAGYYCTNCGDWIAPAHTYTAASIKVVQVYVTTVGELTTGVVKAAYACDACGTSVVEPVLVDVIDFDDADDNKVISTGDVVTFEVVIDDQIIQKVATYDAATTSWS
jgi:hypothetical protein